MSSATTAPVGHDLGRVAPRRRYLSIATTALQQSIAYRTSILLSVLLTFIWVVILYYLWRGAYSARGTIAGFDWDQMRTYIVLAFGLNALVGWRVGSQMMATIRTGDVVLEFVRPLNYATTQLARAVGGGLVEGGAALLVSMGIGLAWIHIRPPASAAAGAWFALSVVLAFVTKVLIIFLVSLLTFWTTSGTGLMWSQQAVLQILSGTIVPLALMPDWLRVVAEIAPMRGIASTPVLLWLGKASGWQAVQLVGLQVLWLAVLWVAANVLWRRAFNALEVQGG